MRKDLKCGIRGPAFIALGILIFGMGQTAFAGNYNGLTAANNTGAAAVQTARVDPQLYPHQVVGNPYSVAGKTYYPAHDPKFDQSGQASWYGAKFHGKLTASGERFDKNAMTAAHPTLPLQSLVKVTNRATGISLIVRINDRGPFTGKGIIDLSEGAAAALGLSAQTGPVRVQYAGPAAPVKTLQNMSRPSRTGSLIPKVSLPRMAIPVPQAYNNNVSGGGGDNTTVLTIKGPIHIA